MTAQPVKLVAYDAACNALAKAVRVDDVKKIRDKAVAIASYARQANDRVLETNAVELRERATRRLGQLIVDAKNGKQISRGQPPKKRSDVEQFSRVKLEEMGVSRKLSMLAQRKAAVPEREFESTIIQMRRAVSEGKSPSDALRAKERDAYRENARDLARELSNATALQPTGRKFPCVYADPAWKRKAGFGNRAYENHYPTMTWDEIMALPVKEMLLPDAWVFLWIPRAHMLALHPVPVQTPWGPWTVKLPLAWAIAQAWGCDAYSTCFVWTKTDEECPEDHGSGLIVWDQDEILCLFKRGRGLPMPSGKEKVGSNHRERPREHSRKPEHYRKMIQRMTGGLPVLELFARDDPENPLPKNWEAWGNQAGTNRNDVSGGPGAGRAARGRGNTRAAVARPRSRKTPKVKGRRR